ncbi:Ribosomal protein lysine methyltransferase [Paramarasmius palmivorus]|uniref:Ribosomal protein lysine methyltransferase n=1 Tax=Paramarasmius palmivorus TaxID=297713 RepID=A0AAW0E9L2_9AGAR
MDSLRFGPFKLPPESERVFDADEEVFLLYTELQSQSQDISKGFRGLGHIDSHKDVLTVKFDLEPPSLPHDQVQQKGKKGKKSGPVEVEIQIAQDKTALRSRKGDTGSVLWHASVDFARTILQQAHFPDPESKGFLQADRLKECHILELGAGTGLLSIALSQLVKHYTVTDIDDLIPLIKKNIQLNIPKDSNSNVTVSGLDWLVLQNAPLQSRRVNFLYDPPIDVLLVVDCIYHPSLLPSLVETIDFLTIPERTVALVVVELRAEDVIREFLQLWLSREHWQIWRVAGSVLGKPYAMWAGMKAEKASDS